MLLCCDRDLVDRDRGSNFNTLPETKRISLLRQGIVPLYYGIALDFTQGTVYWKVEGSAYRTPQLIAIILENGAD
jgi:hypothetical protein